MDSSLFAIVEELYFKSDSLFPKNLFTKNVRVRHGTINTRAG